MQIKKSSLRANEVTAIQQLAQNKSLQIEQTETHFFFPLRTLAALPFMATRANAIMHSDTLQGATVFFDVASRNAEITAFIFDTAFEKGGYYAEFEISEETLIDLCTDLDLFETDGDGGYYTYKEFGADEYGNRDSAKCYQDLDELVNELETYEHADILKAYIMQKGMENMDYCRAASMEEEPENKSFKTAIEAVLNESGLAIAA